MKLKRTIELIMLYNACPKCGNEYVGDGEGDLIVDTNLFIRRCKCGFEIKIEE